MELTVAATDDSGIIGIAAWESADSHDVPNGVSALLLHGIYVEPGQMHCGIGRRLLTLAEQAAGEGGFNGLLVKAQAGAEGFFNSCGMERLPIENAGRDYPHRFWKAVPGKRN